MRLAARSLLACGLVASAGLARAQDPLKLLRDSYRLQLDNEWVRVVRVHYAPHARLPAHDHTKAAAAFVYLNDCGPVLFKHVGAGYGIVERPATVAGGGAAGAREGPDRLAAGGQPPGRHELVDAARRVPAVRAEDGARQDEVGGATLSGRACAAPRRRRGSPSPRSRRGA